MEDFIFCGIMFLVPLLRLLVVASLSGVASGENRV